MKTYANFIRLFTCSCLLFALFAYPKKAYACSCPSPGSPAEEFSQHSAVFTGTVIRIADNYSPLFSNIDYILFSQFGKPSFFFRYFDNNHKTNQIGFSIFFKIISSWKGVETTNVEVSTGRGDADCGDTFLTGEEYLIYANYAYGIPGNYWITGICSRNSILTTNLEDMNYLSTKSTLPLKPSIPKFWTTQELIILSLLSIPILVVIGIRKIRKNKKQGSSEM
jgi:hypothetical protein